VHGWTTGNGLKLNLIKSQVTVISCCRVDIPPPSLLIGSDVIKVVPKVNNLGFVLNVQITATAHFKRVCQKVYWILRSMRPHASHTPFEIKKRFVVSLIMPHIGYGVLCMLVRMLHCNGGLIWLLDPVYGTFIL
jgi:hypothetical protein